MCKVQAKHPLTVCTWWWCTCAWHVQSAASNPAVDLERPENPIRARMPVLFHQYDRIPPLRALFETCAVPADVPSPCDFKDTAANIERLRNKANIGFEAVGR